MKKTVSFLLIAALVISLVPFSAVAGGIVLTGIESISYTPADENAYVYYENTNGDWQKDGQSNDYFNYRINFNENDVLTVNYSNDTVKQYVAVFNNGIEFVSADNEVLKSWDDVGIFNDQYNEHWYSGGTYTFYVEYLGYKAPVTASVINNPVVSISYQPRSEVVEYFEYGGNFQTDNDNNTYYRYNVISINTGDRLTVTYNDDRGTVEYVCLGSLFVVILDEHLLDYVLHLFYSTGISFELLHDLFREVGEIDTRHLLAVDRFVGRINGVEDLGFIERHL